MNVIIFEDVTTESALLEIEANGKKYEGLYVEMDNAPERKYVKGMASEISDMLKKLDRARIDKSKDYKRQVESEALAIKSRLEKANEPFTLLIDEYAAKRANILAKEKAARDAIELNQKIKQDHEFALLLDAKFEAEALQREKDRLEYEEKLKAEAVEDARLQIEADADHARIEIEAKARAESDEAERKANDERLAADKRELELRLANERAEREKLEAEQRAERVEANAKAEVERKAEFERQQAASREADKKHHAKINSEALDDFVTAGLSKRAAKIAVTALASKSIRHSRINY